MDTLPNDIITSASNKFKFITGKSNRFQFIQYRQENECGKVHPRLIQNKQSSQLFMSQISSIDEPIKQQFRGVVHSPVQARITSKVSFPSMALIAGTS